jgi:phage terminase large subunit GpA-like protein
MQDINWKGQTLKKGVALYLVGSDTAKHLLYNRLNSDADKDPSARKVHFSTELDPVYYDGLVSETFNPQKNRWELKKGKRNEPLDTWILSVAATHHPELYLHKWKKSDWDRRAAMIEPLTHDDEEQTAIEVPAIEKKQKAPRLRRNSGFVKGWK